jgi:carboxymethylenebutenolidase
MLEDFMAAYGYLKSHPECSGKVGVVGFCFGGWISNMMAVRLSDLGAAVPFYGSQPADEEVTRINAPLLLQYAGLDKRINEGWPAFEAALKTHKKAYTAHIYPEVTTGSTMILPPVMTKKPPNSPGTVPSISSMKNSDNGCAPIGTKT